MRDKIRKALLSQNITQIDVEYSGYGDSGNIDGFLPVPTPTPDFMTIPHPWYPDRIQSLSLQQALEHFIWAELVEMYHAGFENNDGGGGEIHWDLENDKITYRRWNYETVRCNDETITA